MNRDSFNIKEPHQTEVIKKALKAFETPRIQMRYKYAHLMVVVDMTLPSYMKRFWVVGVNNSEVIKEHHVAHGINSNAKDRAYADKFSNKIMSKQSCTGSMKTGSVYYGRNGKSLNLHGLDKGINDNAFIRRIVIHKAKYVTDPYILRNERAGNSWGCLALDPAVCSDIIELIKDGCFVYIHA